MQVNELLVDAFGRLPALVGAAVEDLSPDQLTWAPRPEANPIGWLVWHLARIQDDHVAALIATPQVWVGGDWAERCGLSPDPDDTGFGHTAEQAARVRPESGAVLVDYYQAVAARTATVIDNVTAGHLDRVVDRRWDPPVTMGVRLLSVLNDNIQHAGQAAYVRGLLPG